MPPLNLEEHDETLLAGEAGPGAALAMRVVVEMARMQRAARLIDVTSAHIDGCLYHGQASLDLAERLAAGGATVGVPATLNVGKLDLLHPNLYRGDPEEGAAARRLMDTYRSLGCRPTWTCAPYQLEQRPGFGEHVAWAESNAIAFANSVLGARTDRYGDFIDICAAITGRVPYAGLHRGENRRATVLVRLVGVPDEVLGGASLAPVLGHLVGRLVGNDVPAIEGLPEDIDEDRLKALAAAAASSGSVALFHVLGRTPEAPNLEEAFHGRAPGRVVDVSMEELRAARAGLSTAQGEALSAVSLGTPHFSFAEFEHLITVLSEVDEPAAVEFYVSTGRDVLARVEEAGWTRVLQRYGVQVVTDTCTYVTPIIRNHEVVMTNSAKWAYYAPGNLGIEVVFGSLEACVRSAAAGEVRGDLDGW